MSKMGSPWPLTQEPVKSPTSGAPSTAHNNHSNHANNKRPSYSSYSPYHYYNNHVNQGYHQNQQNYNSHNQHHHPSLPQSPHAPQHSNGNHFQNNRYIPISPTSSMEVTNATVSKDVINRKRSQTHQNYFTFEGNHPSNQHYQQSHHQQFSPLRRFSSSSISSPAASSPTITTTSTFPPPSPLSANSVNSLTSKHSQFVTLVKEIPTWNRYYSDQKHRIIDFTDKNNSIRPDSSINQLVSLCFVDTCITNLAVDAIVNSTTDEYSGADGVDKLIHQHAGTNLREFCSTLPKLAPGQAEMTSGFSLPAKYIIHTNGPLTENDEEQLTGCYVNSFNLLLMNRLRTIAFPCISTGIKGLAKKFAAEIALRTVRLFLEKNRHSVDRVIFCLHHQKDIEIYLRYMQIYFPVEAGFTAAP